MIWRYERVIQKEIVYVALEKWKTSMFSTDFDYEAIAE